VAKAQEVSRWINVQNDFAVNFQLALAIC